MDNNLVRTIIALFLSMLVLLGFQYFLMPPEPKKTEPQKAQPKPQPPVALETATAEKAPEAAKPQPIFTADPSAKEKLIPIETELYSAVFTTKGGSIKSWKLKKQTDKDGKPVNLINLPPTIPPLSLLVEGGDNAPLTQLNYSTDANRVTLSEVKNNATLTMKYEDGEKQIIKSFTFYNDNYHVDFTLETKGVSSYFLPIGTNVGIYEHNDRAHFGPALLMNSDRKQFKSGDVDGGVQFFTPVTWIAQEDKYFTAALAPKTETQRAKVWESGKDIDIAFALKEGKYDFLLYMGPKEIDRLKALNYHLDDIVYLGWSIIQPIARPLFWFLKKLYAYLHNYGLAIILLTLLIRIPFIPLINKGQRSMKKMQALQPKLLAIKEKHKDDAQKMNTEIMELYKTHKVHPLGGCLPMLIQIPIFIALYNVLDVAVELRMAPFYWWITDLSAKDPYYILPLVMGVTMVIQQQMTPSNVDPTQAKLMMLMPIFFTFLFINFPSGLVLYWLVNNLLAITQQFFVNRTAE
jgi:YidC/Oxa1 family membrane protein insertase